MDVQTMEQVCQIIGIGPVTVDRGNHVLDRVRRIFSRSNMSPDTPDFEDSVREAERQVDEEGGRALMQSLYQCTSAPPEKEYKIKRVAKGQRIEAVSASGVRFSFGPVWCESVKVAKGIAVNPHHREKLNMHGTFLGVDTPEKLSPLQLCQAITARM